MDDLTYLDAESLYERVRYSKVYEDPGYRKISPALRNQLIWEPWLGELNSIIDFGCGTGKIIPGLIERGKTYTGIDIVDVREHKMGNFILASLWMMPKIQAEFGMCIDVLEHMPTDKIGTVLSAISDSVTHRTFLDICLLPDKSGPRLLGQPLHYTVRPEKWWYSMIRDTVPKWESISCKVYSTTENIAFSIMFWLSHEPNDFPNWKEK